jgi:3-oxoacyl-[acyl-carrier protein] reductase
MTHANDSNMTSRTAVVTGAGRGIGAAIARRLAADGRAISAMDLDEAATAEVVDDINRSGGRALSIVADVSDEEAVISTVATIADQLGDPTVLINNAGIIRDNLIFKMGLDDWDDVIDVHLRGAFLMTRAVQQYMVRARWGRIVNLSSTSALGKRGQANYAAAKAGLQGFTKALALELGPLGVTANAVAPGFVETQMTAATAARMGMSFDDLKEETAASLPVRRTGKPDDVAHAVSFFASERTGYITGQVLYVAGGPRS